MCGDHNIFNITLVLNNYSSLLNFRKDNNMILTMSFCIYPCHNGRLCYSDCMASIVSDYKIPGADQNESSCIGFVLENIKITDDMMNRLYSLKILKTVPHKSVSEWISNVTQFVLTNYQSEDD